MPSVVIYIFSSSILSFTDSFRSFLQCFSWCFRVHLDFISRATMISHSVLFLDFLRAIIFSPLPSSIPFSHPFISRRVFAHVATRRPISRYPLTCRRFFTRDTFPLHPPRAHAILTIQRTLESHKALRRIFHAVISANRDERRYSSRRSEKWEDLIWTRSDEISLASY